ncbi:sugar porter family MFS transporter [Microbacterium amylolyticum]|uniref:Sugar porter (SP) family MFS transporter n=1 Tax=Microbacterium amylolyticum TaxID=936337 RepID=A0ABS4ZFF9_9MICO|nr:sugar porter family MFS transporter [Microbacterium amylolyticum]MBP2436018.1 sugar porter (SP) family MFS transporter [Microbacterium amylolyticum]
MTNYKIPGASAATPPMSRVVFIAAAAAMGGFLFGFDTAVINGAVGAVGEWSGAGPVLLGFSVAGALLACAFGAWFAGPISARFGRVRVMQVAAIVFLISAIGSGLAWDITSLTVFRFIGGFGVGAASVIAPAYIAEVSPSHVRGRLGSLQQLAIVIGIFVSLLSNYMLAQAAGGAGSTLWLGLEAWRWMFIVEAVPAIIYGILASVIPESPRYLVSKNRTVEAEAVLGRYVGGTPTEIVKTIQSSLDFEATQSIRVIRGPRFGLAPIVWIGIALSLFQQLVGINVIFYYSTMLWEAVGFDESNALLTGVITSVVNIATTIVAILLVDRIGRRPLLLIGSIGMLLTLATMAFVFGTAPTTMIDGATQPVLTGAAGIVAVVAANLYVVFFGMSWGPVVWVLLGEMFNNRIRAYAISVAAAAQWVANFAVSLTFPSLAQAGLGLAYGLYAAMAALSLLFVIKFVKETKGRELESM